MHNLSDQNKTIAEPVVVISDVHLDACENVERKLNQLRPLWRGASAVIFNGDTMNSNLSRFDNARRDIVELIERICREDGVEPLMITGNSDRHLAGVRHVTLGSGRIVVLHGDVVFPSASPWRAEAKQLLTERKRAIESLPQAQRQTLAGQLEAATLAYRSVALSDDRPCRRKPWYLPALIWSLPWLARPRRVLAVLRAWRDMPKLTAAFIDRYAPQAELVVIGHAHHRGIWRVGSRTIINTGSFERFFRPLMVQFADGKLVVRKIDRNNGDYVPGEILDYFTVAESPDPTGRSRT